MKRFVFILLGALILLIAIFTHFFGNIWHLTIDSGYFIPTESNIFTFNATKWNDGSGDWWLYGEDKHFYYGLNIEDTTPKYFTLHKGLEPEYFDRYDYKTWVEATVEIADVKIREIKDTLLINGLQLIKISNEDTTQFYCLTNINGDTIVPFADYYHQIIFLDINEDCYTDIRVYHFSKTPNQCDNYLFDKTHNVFRLVKNCMLDIKKIKGTNYYYSYYATTCADMNWESDLSKIENYQLVTYGRIYGNGCDSDSENKKTIRIYKASGGNEVLIKTFPYTKHIPKYSDKWEFVEQYWSRNYRDFE